MEDILYAGAVGGLNYHLLEDAVLFNIINNGENARNVPEFQFSLDDITAEDAKRHFRFSKEDIPRLAEALRLPRQVRTDKRNTISGVNALCVVLKRLAYPNRLSDIGLFFGLSPQSLSSIINTTISFIIRTHGGLLSNLENLVWLNRNRLTLYSEAIANRGAALRNCWGFIDGTTRPMCRPSTEQENYYSGHKRYHCLKYQSVVCPDGIIASLKGAYEGRRHDAAIFRESGLYNELEAIARFPDNQIFVLFGDQAYGIMELLQCPYAERRRNLLDPQRDFNQAMSIVRTAVEWGFQKIVQQFAFIDFKKNLKLLLQDLECLYKTAALLTNCHTCLYGSQHADYFNVAPPTLEEYLGFAFENR